MCIEWQLIHAHGGKPAFWVVGLAFGFRFFGLDLIIFKLITVEPTLLVLVVVSDDSESFPFCLRCVVLVCLLLLMKIKALKKL